MANKILKVKFWEDDEGKSWKRNVQEIEGEVLCGMLPDMPISGQYTHSILTMTVSQFTLLAATKKGNKPDFHNSAPAIQARELYDHFFAKVQSTYREDRVKNGIFQAMMDVGLVNDGPVGVDYCCEDEQVNCPVLSLGCLMRNCLNCFPVSSLPPIVC